MQRVCQHLKEINVGQETFSQVVFLVQGQVIHAIFACLPQGHKNKYIYLPGATLPPSSALPWENYVTISELLLCFARSSLRAQRCSVLCVEAASRKQNKRIKSHCARGAGSPVVLLLPSKQRITCVGIRGTFSVSLHFFFSYTDLLLRR